MLCVSAVEIVESSRRDAFAERRLAPFSGRAADVPARDDREQSGGRCSKYNFLRPRAKSTLKERRGRPHLRNERPGLSGVRKHANEQFLRLYASVPTSLALTALPSWLGSVQFDCEVSVRARVC